MVSFPAGYYNNFDPSKKYKQLLFRAARGLQSTEMNEIQATLEYEFTTLNNVTYGDGALLRGGKLSPASAGGFSITAALFWARGYTHTLDPFAFTIGNTETTTVGVAITERVITEDDDPDLRDPAINTRNFNEPGAHRLKMSARWVKVGDKTPGEYFYGVIEYKDGAQVSQPVNPPELNAVKDILARYDFAAHGSYVVNGMYVTYIADDNTTKEHIFSVSDGLAHVEGYEIALPYATRIRLPMALDTKAVNNEPVTFTADGVYPLRYSPIATVGEVNGIAETTSTITHANFNGGSDLVPNTPLVEIVSINQGGTWNGSGWTGGQTYTAGTDFVRTNDTIDWSPVSPNEPAPGSAYQVRYRYSRVVVATINGALTGLNVAGFAPGTVFYVDYTYYIPRIDLIQIQRDGLLHGIKGVPDFLNPQPPKVVGGLTLAQVTLKFGTTPSIKDVSIRAYQNDRLQTMQGSIDDIRYNVNRLALLESIRTNDPTTVMRGSFVDPMTTDDLRDAGISQNAATSSLGLSPGIVWDTRVIASGAPVLLPYTLVTYFEQPFFTKSRIVNAYMVVDPPPAVVTLTPANYNFVASNSTLESWSSLGLLTAVSVSTTALGGTRPLPQINLSVSADKFNNNESVAVYFDSVQVGTGNADANGHLSYSFTTPAWAQTGARQVRVVGTVSGVVGSAVFNSTALGQVTTVAHYDPLAETFAFDEDVFVGSVDVIFEKNTTTNVDVLVTQATLGTPDRTAVVAQKRLFPADITPTTGKTYTPALLDRPYRLRAAQEYAAVVGCNDATASIRVAELGGYDPVAGRWVSQNAYARGVLAESANLSSWSFLPKEDMTLRLRRAKFALSNTVNFAQVNAVTVTDLVLLANVEVVSGTSVQFNAVLIDRDNESYVLTPGVATVIPEYTGRIAVSAVLRTATDMLSPLIYGDVSLVLGQVQFPSTYVSRAVPVPSGATAIKAFAEIVEAGVSSVTVEYRNAADTAWVAIPRNASGALQVGAGWVDMPFPGMSAASGLSVTRFRVTLNSSNKAQRSGSRKLRVSFS